MKLTRAGEYGIRCVLYLARQPEGSVCLLDEMCEHQNSPKYLTAKVLQMLVRGEILNSSRGSGGGYSLARKASKISMLDVIECIEGPLYINVCIKEGECETSETCPVHCVWLEAQRKFCEVLTSHNFSELAKKG